MASTHPKTANAVTGKGPDESIPDPELQRLCALQEEHGATWDGPGDPRNPYNWSSTRKIAIAVIASAGQLVTLMSASMMAPALPEVAEDIGLSMSAIQVSFSIYFLGMGLGPFLLSPLSEIYGRKAVFIGGNVFYLLWNTICPVGDNSGLVIISRFMAGCGASVGVALTTPIMADMYYAKDRGKSLAIANLLPYLGPALGPIVGGILSDKVQWHWLFWTLSIFDAVITIIGFVFIHESYTPLLLTRLAAGRGPSLERTETLLQRGFYADLFKKLRMTLVRPVQLLTRRPVMQLISFVMAVNFAIYVLLLSTFATLFMERYHHSELISSLHYIAIALGSTLAAQIGGPLMDYIWKYLTARNKGVEKPEYRAPVMVIGSILMPAGLLWYGWCAEKYVTWVMVDIGACIFSFGCFIITQGLAGYLLDEFKHAASANAASRLLSFILGFAFPIFGPQLYDYFGYGWGNSLLALIFIVLGLPPPFIFWYRGAELRALGKKE